MGRAQRLFEGGAQGGKVLDGRRPMMERKPDGSPRLATGGKTQYRLLPTDTAPPPPDDTLDFDAEYEERDPFADPE